MFASVMFFVDAVTEDILLNSSLIIPLYQASKSAALNVQCSFVFFYYLGSSHSYLSVGTPYFLMSFLNSLLGSLIVKSSISAVQNAPITSESKIPCPLHHR